MIDKVEVDATYDHPRDVPIIGQRKRMRVNGRLQTMTLNKLNVSRRWTWDDDAEKSLYEYAARETWGAFYIG